MPNGPIPKSGEKGREERESMRRERSSDEDFLLEWRVKIEQDASHRLYPSSRRGFLSGLEVHSVNGGLIISTWRLESSKDRNLLTI